MHFAHIGGVPLYVYWRLIKSCGGVVLVGCVLFLFGMADCCLMLVRNCMQTILLFSHLFLSSLSLSLSLSLVIGQAIAVGSDWWLSVWVSDSFDLLDWQYVLAYTGKQKKKKKQNETKESL